MLLCKSFTSHYLATFHSLKQIELAFSLNGFPVLIRVLFAQLQKKVEKASEKNKIYNAITEMEALCMFRIYCLFSS